MSHPDFPPPMIDKMPLERALELLDFIPTATGYTRKWDDLEFSAGESFDCWFLIRGGFCTKRTAFPPHEERIYSPIAPIDLMATIYRRWSEVYFSKESLDTFLIWGKEWIDYQREIRKLIPPPPSLWAEREFFRHCLNYIEQQYDWIDEEYDIVFSQAPGQLRINAKEIELYCPARGNWIGEMTISAKSLFRWLPKRFIGQVVSLQAKSDKLIIDSRQFPARWSEHDKSKQI